jgi:Zn-dependent alcohol dehydrogenase
MRAAVMHAVGAPMTVEDVTVAEPVGHEVLIRTAAAGLCHSDLLFLSGEWDHPIPTILGHEVAGVVEAVGHSVGYVEPGDHVIGCAGGPCYTAVTASSGGLFCARAVTMTGVQTRCRGCLARAVASINTVSFPHSLNSCSCTRTRR